MGNVEYYKKQIIDLRERVKREQESKKRDNETYARLIKGSSSSSSKASYKKSKIDHAASHDRAIASLKDAIARAQYSLAQARRK